MKIKAIRNRLVALCMCAGCCVPGALRATAAVGTASGPVDSAAPFENDADEWFAEIDDMIQEKITPPVTAPDAGKRPAVLPETNRSVRAEAGRNDAKAVDSMPGARGQEASVAVVEVAAGKPDVSRRNTLIQELLQSDYWLEDDPLPIPERKKETQAGPLRVNAPGADDVTFEASFKEDGLPKQVLSTEDELLALEEELLDDLSGETGLDERGMEETLRQLEAVQAKQTEQTAAREAVVSINEEALLAELESMTVKEETPAAVVEDVEQVEAVDTLTEDLPAIDEMLTQAEESIPETAADSPVESNAYDRLRDVQQAIQQALADGDTAQLIALTAEMNRLAMNLEAAPTEAPEPVQEVVMPPARSLAEAVRRQQQPKIADVSQVQVEQVIVEEHFVTDLPEEITPDRKQLSSLQNKPQPERRAHVFRNRQVVVIGPEEQQNPLRTERVSEMASEVPASTPQKKPESAPEVVAKKPVPVKKIVQLKQAAPAPRPVQARSVQSAGPGVDATVFLQKPVDSEMRRPVVVAPQGGAARGRAAVVVPPAAPAEDDWNAPVPMGW